MKITFKKFIVNCLINGIIYAGIMAGVDYHNGNGFRLWKFIFETIFFGLSMTLFSLFFFKKKNQENEENKQKKSDY